MVERLVEKLDEMGGMGEMALLCLFLPQIPTSAGIDLGDDCGVATADLYFPDGTLLGTVEVLVYFGKKHPFGNLYRMVHGILVNYDSTAKKGTAYVRKSLYEQDSYDPSKGYIEAGTVCMTDGYISALLTDKLAFLPTETAATPMTGFCDDHWSGVESNNSCACVSGGLAIPGTDAGT
ncbi:MAG: hypothetical protein LUF04_16130, partial [Bacteroides sp.]|nr:hypothetical protein [Bacteroides sp.]